MLRRLSLAAALLLLPATSALADSGLYIGFHGGVSGVDVEIDGGRLRLESKELAWKAFGGFALGRFVAVETGYVNLGTAQTSDTAIPLEQSLWGWDTAGLLKLNLGPVDFYGRLGGIYWKAKVGIGDSGVNVSDDGFDLNYGGGIGVVLDKLAIRGELVWYDAKSVGTPWMASAGLTLSF